MFAPGRLSIRRMPALPSDGQIQCKPNGSFSLWKILRQPHSSGCFICNSREGPIGKTVWKEKNKLEGSYFQVSKLPTQLWQPKLWCWLEDRPVEQNWQSRVKCLWPTDFLFSPACSAGDGTQGFGHARQALSLDTQPTFLIFLSVVCVANMGFNLVFPFCEVSFAE
jgi:hypothetical protein